MNEVVVFLDEFVLEPIAPEVKRELMELAFKRTIKPTDDESLVQFTIGE